MSRSPSSFEDDGKLVFAQFVDLPPRRLPLSTQKKSHLGCCGNERGLDLPKKPCPVWPGASTKLTLLSSNRAGVRLVGALDADDVGAGRLHIFLDRIVDA